MTVVSKRRWTVPPAIGFFLDLDAGRIHVREDGHADAPAVVLIHGFASSMHWYDLVTPLLSPRFRVIRIDLIGHGHTTHRRADFRSAAQVAMVSEVLDALGVDRFVAVGHSFGADVAIGVAAGSPGAGAAVIIGQGPDYVTATLPPGSRLLGRRLVTHGLQVLSRLAPARLGGIAFAPGFRPDLAFPDPGQAWADLRAMDPRVARAVIVDRDRELREAPLDARLATLDVPAMAILGGRDQMYPVVSARARYQAVRGLRVEVIGSSGHSPIVERPQDVADLIESFLSEA